MTTTKQPKKPSSKSSVNERRRRAAERLEATASLTVAQRLAILDARLGKGVGAVKERAKLAAKAGK